MHPWSDVSLEFIKKSSIFFVAEFGSFLLHRDIIERWNGRMVWVVRDLKDHLVPALPPWVGIHSPRPDC